MQGIYFGQSKFGYMKEGPHSAPENLILNIFSVQLKSTDRLYSLDLSDEAVLQDLVLRE